MFFLQRKGDYQLQFTRTLKTPERHVVELYLFIPPDTHLSSTTLPEQQFFFRSISHRFGLMGLQAKPAGKGGDSSALQSPHFELANGSSLFRYKASMGRLRQQLLGSDTPADQIGRALRLSQAFAQRMRENRPPEGRPQRFHRQMDIYFSWFAEQFFLECMTLESFAALDEDLRRSVADFLQQEAKHRLKQEYGRDFQGTPTALWNRMSLYNRLLEYPASLREKIVELGAGTRKLVKAASTMVIMLMFTYLLFNARNASETLSITVLLGIALIYGIRDMVREDMINVITRRLRRGKPRWKVQLRVPYTRKQVAQQLIWVDYRKLSELSRRIADNAIKSATGDEAQVICYRSLLRLDKAALAHDEIRERLSLNFEALCERIQVSQDRLFAYAEGDDPAAEVQIHPIERQQDYHLLLVSTQAGQRQASAQLWRLRLGRKSIVECKSRDATWPGAEDQSKRD